jgi:nucleotide-binding universal stress UspA family protein
LASDTASEVSLLHVREITSNARVLPLESPADARAVLDDALSYLRSAGVVAAGETCTARDEHVAALIVEQASLTDCSAIVLGSRRLRGFGRLAGRGVRERVLRLTTLPVITAPTPAYRQAS